MAFPTKSDVETAVTNLFNALNELPAVVPNARSAVASLQEVAQVLAQVYVADVDFTVNDQTDADLAAFFAADGELGVALGREARVGDVFKVAGAGDTTDDALAGAKGSDVADNDVFIVDGIGSGASVQHLGNGDADFSSEEVADFISIGS